MKKEGKYALKDSGTSSGNDTSLSRNVCDLLAGVTAKNRQPLLDYLREHGEEEFVRAASFRTEEPLKHYRQWCLDDLIERAKKNGVI